jgi:hypothetical protein
MMMGMGTPNCLQMKGPCRSGIGKIPSRTRRTSSRLFYFPLSVSLLVIEAAVKRLGGICEVFFRDTAHGFLAWGHHKVTCDRGRVVAPDFAGTDPRRRCKARRVRSCVGLFNPDRRDGKRTRHQRERSNCCASVSPVRDTGPRRQSRKWAFSNRAGHRSRSFLSAEE